MAGESKGTGQPAAPKAGTIPARVDLKLKAMAKGIFSHPGLIASDAIRLFCTAVALTSGTPFEVKTRNAPTRETLEDINAGKSLTRYASADEMFKDMSL